MTPDAPLMEQIRQAVFDAVMHYYGHDEQDMDDQSDATELTDAIMKQVEKVLDVQ